MKILAILFLAISQVHALPGSLITGGGQPSGGADVFASVTAGSVTVTNLPANSVVFTGTGGLLSAVSTFSYNGTGGMVGIGTAVPISTLTVVGVIYSSGVSAGLAIGDVPTDLGNNTQINIQPRTLTNATIIHMKNTGGDFYMGRDNSTGSQITGVAYATFLWDTSSTRHMKFGTNNTSRLGIDANGAILSASSFTMTSNIGNSGVPMMDFIPATNTNLATIHFSNSGGNFYVGSDNTAGTAVGCGAYGNCLWGVSNVQTAFATNNTRRMTVAAGGNVGIGTNVAPVTLLHMSSGALTLDGTGVWVVATSSKAVTTLSGCGTGAVFLPGSSDVAGKITTQTTGVQTCVMQFTATVPTARAPACQVTNETTANLSRATSTASQATFSGTTVAGDVLAYTCIAF